MRIGIIYILVGIISIVNSNDITAIQKLDTVKLLHQDVIHTNSNQHDSLISKLQLKLNKNPKLSDTKASSIYLQLGKLYAFQQNFSEAFDYTEQALRISEKTKDSILNAQSSLELGKLYTNFGKEEQSLELLLNALSLNKSLHRNGKVTSNPITGTHYYLAMHYIKFDNLNLALAHLDTCEIIGQRDNHIEIYMNYHRGEQAKVYTELGKTDTAKVILHKIEAEIIENVKNTKVQTHIKGYLSKIYYYLGNAYLKEKQYKQAIENYRQAIYFNQKYGLFNNISSDILENLAIAEAEVANYKQAYQHLKKSKELGDANYNISKLQNNSLVEIKSRYKDELENQNLELLKKDKVVAEQSRSLLIFRVFLVGLILLIVIGSLVILNRLQKANFLRERKESELRQKESEEAFEVKNKELTAFTLKLIDKNKIIADLLDKLKEGKTDVNSVHSIEKSIQASSSVLWDEFNTRFIEVNVGFYERLQRKFKDLSATERKHCALIKLNFSGKEMAQLLGISVTSVHVSRYRLRKRFGLDKSQNLTDFISNI